LCGDVLILFLVLMARQPGHRFINSEYLRAFLLAYAVLAPAHG
jgi:hypothetical protein